MKNLKYDSLQKAADGLFQECKRSSLPSLHLVPFSRFSQVHSSLWWLCAERAKTYYNQGKLIIGKPERYGGEDGVFCGLHVERGMKMTLDSSAEKLGKDWQWHNFFRDLDGALGAAVEKASGQIGNPLQAYVFANHDGKTDRVPFQISGQTLSAEDASYGLRVLNGFESCTTWPELKRNLSSLPAGSDWYWIGVHIGATFSLNSTGSDDQSACVKLFECFQPWLGRKT